MVASPHYLPVGTRVCRSATPHTRKISIPLINNPPGKYCLVHLSAHDAAISPGNFDFGAATSWLSRFLL
jgi:hypothetical protein